MITTMQGAMMYVFMDIHGNKRSSTYIGVTVGVSACGEMNKANVFITRLMVN